MKEIAFYKDQFVDINDNVIPIQERGHQFGDGIYEVIRVYNGQPFLQHEHMDRLEKSAEAIELNLPYTSEQMIEIMIEGLKKSAITEAEIYIQITRGISARQHNYPDTPAVFSMTVRSARSIAEEEQTEGVSVLTTEDVRWLKCYIKSLNLLPNVMAKQKAIKSGCKEALLVRDGVVTEGSSSNVFVVKDGELFTHPATERILHGITRAKVIEIAQTINISINEQEFNEEFLLQADEAFITSTSVEVMPISKINDTLLPNQRPITQQLMAEYRKLYNL